jgi:hypothetical protein
MEPPFEEAFTNADNDINIYNERVDITANVNISNFGSARSSVDSNPHKGTREAAISINRDK